MGEAEKDEQTPQIEISEKGPYLVKNLGALQNSKGDDLPTKRVIALCRCGASSNKPFCDGTHSDIGFSGERTTDGSEDQRDNYVGKKITIHDNRGVCAHAGICTDKLAAVFRYKQEPWIDPDGSDIEEIVKTVHACPSGALSYTIENVEHKEKEADPAISIAKDGPYVVEGGIELVGQTCGEGAAKGHYTLCRCGRSENKPYCDGSHWDGFKDEEN